MRKSFGVALSLLMAYQVFIIVCVPGWSRPLNQNQGNRIKAERFLQSGIEGDVVVTGSSLFASIEHYLPKGKFTSLAFLGLGPLDGLDLLLGSQRPPRLALIETNKLMRGATRTMAFSPESTAIKSYFPAQREEYCPANLAVPLIYEGLRRLLGGSPTEEHLIESNMRLMRTNGIKDAESELATFNGQSLAALASRVQELDRRGITVVFFEMPGAPELMNSELSVKMRKEIRSAFPRYKFLPRPSPTEETRDGEHLTPAAAERFARKFVAEVTTL